MNNIDEHIIMLIKEKPEQAFSLMYDQYYEYLVMVVFRILQDEGQTKDVVQSVFISMWQRLDKISLITSLKQYLRRSAINKSLNHLRANKKLSFDHESIEEVDINDGQDHTLSMEADELQERIGEAIASLPERCRLIFNLSRYEDMSNKEIAEKLDISVKTVENQMTKALKLMRIKINIIT